MTKTDLDAFSMALKLVAEACGKRLTPDTIDAYNQLLDDLPIGLLCRGMERFARMADTGRKFPSPRELRAWLSEGAAPDGMTADQEARIRQRVSESMVDWEAEGRPGGSAWPTFELAWSAALRREGLRGDLRPLRRQAAWQTWLWHGATKAEDAPTATREQVEATLRDVLPRCSPLFANGLRAIADRIALHRAQGCTPACPPSHGGREPGSDDV